MGVIQGMDQVPPERVKYQNTLLLAGGGQDVPVRVELQVEDPARYRERNILLQEHAFPFLERYNEKMFQR